MADLSAEATPAEGTIAVIGCGNANRSDDGVGGAVLRLLAARNLDSAPSLVRLLDAGTDGVAVMFAARGCQRLIVVDACRSGAEPGAVFEVPGEALGDTDAPPLATHEFRWDHAIAAGRRIFRDDFPADVTVFLVEAESVGFGIELTPRVAASVVKVADRIGALMVSPVLEAVG
jgi:hydrogenase maturation protease